MTKKHFIAIAANFRDAYTQASAGGESARLACLHTIHAFCNAARNDNPRFDIARFLAACGVSQVN